MKNFRFLLGLVCLILSVSMPASAQDIVIDWEANKLTASPREVSQSTNAQLIIINVNDILYTYDVNLIATPRVPNDFALLRPVIAAPAAGVPAALAPTSCAALISQANLQITALRNQLTALLTAPDQGSDKFRSIKLSETIKTWNEKVLPLISPLEDTINRLRAATCNAAETPQQEAVFQTHLALAGGVAQIKSRVNSDHRIVRTVTLLPDNDYKVTVEEKYSKADGSSVVTDGGKREFTFSPVSNVLTLSAGVLLTGLQQRSYLNRKDPTMDKNVLAIDGTGTARPIGVALLNYQIPRTRFFNDQMGFNLASG